MAFIYSRKDSEFWWIRYRARNGQIIRQSTKLRADDRQQTRKARMLAHHKTGDELETAPVGQRDRWDFWVPGYLSARYERKPKSLLRYTLAWKNLEAFLNKRRIQYPAQLTYIHCRDYFEYRKKGDRELGVLRGHHNTALLEVKTLAMIMKEAIRRGFAGANPAQAMGIGRIEPAEKPEFTDDDLQMIWTELRQEPEWMRICWQIGLFTGCRLRATVIPLRDIDVDARRIIFHEKGGKVFEVPMRDELVPLFKSLINQRKTVTCEMPALPSKAWHTFFHRIGLPQYCFHCLRVTFITRAARAGLQERDVMRLVNHASTTIHRIYLRLRAADLEKPLQKIHFPAQLETPANAQPIISI
jgi:site-specific recombinase XerD